MKTKKEVCIPWNEEHMDALLEDILTEIEEEIIQELKEKENNDNRNFNTSRMVNSSKKRSIGNG